MFARNAFTTILAVAAPLVVRAIVTPSEPAPGDVFKASGTCHIAWIGDTLSTTEWKNMSIELMSGSNLDMNHITTVTTGQDGTADGSFDYTCPEVTPNSDIYFYQFSSPQISNLTWTGRFTISSDSGATTDPANALQPSGDAIPWGIGALVDPSTAVAAPVIGTTPSTEGTTVASGSVSATASVTPVAATSSIAVIQTTKSLTTVVSSAAASSTASTTASAASTQQATTNSGAIAFGIDARVGLGAVALFAIVLL